MTHLAADTLPAPLTRLAEDERLLRDSVREFADGADPAARPRDGRARQDSAGAHRQAVRARRHGHRDSRERTAAPAARFFHAVLAVEELSRVDPSVGVLVDVQNTLVINALLRWGSDDIKRALAAAARGAAPSAPTRCRRPARAATRSRCRRARVEDGDGYVLDGPQALDHQRATKPTSSSCSRPSIPRPATAASRRSSSSAARRASPSARRKTSSASARQQHVRAALRGLPRAEARTCSARSARATRSRSRR